MMLDTLNDQLSSHVLERFITTFLGYGNVRAPLWFIGKEEGGDCSPDSLRERFAWWQARGCLAVDDLEEYHAQTRLARFVHREAQATWIQLSRVALAAQFLPSDRAASLAYQIAGSVGAHPTRLFLNFFRCQLRAQVTGHTAC